MQGPLGCSLGPMSHNLHLEETSPASPAGPARRLVLSWGGHEVEVTQERPSLTVGRWDLSGIVIKDDLVSRLHARIQHCSLGFSLTDQSSNGTYVADSAGTIHKVCNCTHLLSGAGTISFGIDPAGGRPRLIRYAVRF
jgi:pSer/pThr/pTyr-binding forkhead associated (FHA) protein